jgi:methylphosphonate synthase
MSRLGPFRPEWIEELRVVSDPDPENPDVGYNNGHLMMQTTFFIGPVNFYYELRGKKYCFEANTGDSNFISPFVKHSFTSRDPDQQALIIAVTYGGAVRKALGDFARMGGERRARSHYRFVPPRIRFILIFTKIIGTSIQKRPCDRTLGERAEALSGDLRDEEGYRAPLLGRHLRAECMSPEGFAARVAPAVGGAARAAELVAGAPPAEAELVALAAELSISPAHLAVDEGAMHHHEEVVLTRRHSGSDSDDPVWVKSNEPRRWPDAAEEAGYCVEPLARTPHQPQLKTFNFVVAAAEGAPMQCGLHQFLYVHGAAPTVMQWGERFEHERVLAPGDSSRGE